MMLVLAVLALAAAEPPAATPSAVAPPAAEASGDDTASSLAGLQQVYDQSCAAREYGAYDDLCDQLSHQLKDARAEAARQARRKTAGTRLHPQAAAAIPGSAAPTIAPSPAANSAAQSGDLAPRPPKD